MTENQIDEVLYKDAKFIGLTDIGRGLLSPGPILNYQTKKRYIENVNVKRSKNKGRRE